jgi:hypothetical protein
MQFRPPPQITPFQATVQNEIAFVDWLAGMDKVLALAYEVPAADWQNLRRVHDAIRQASEHLLYEGEIVPHQNAVSALDFLFRWDPKLRGPFESAFARTDQALSRRVVLTQFASRTRT